MPTFVTTFRGVVAAIGVCFCFLPCAIAEANTPWRVQQAEGRFSIRSQVNVPNGILAILRALETDIAQTLKLKVGKTPIVIHLFRNHLEQSKYLSVRVPSAANRSACFVQGTDAGRIYLHAHRDWQKDLRHEATHAVLHSALPYVPLWLDEGLAQFFEATPKERARFHPYGADVQLRMRFLWRPKLSDLETKRTMPDLKQKDYRAAWSWVFFLLEESQESRNLFLAYLQEIANDRAPDPLSEWLAKRMPSAQQRWLAFMKTAK